MNQANNSRKIIVGISGSSGVIVNYLIQFDLLYFPKGSGFDTISNEDVARVENLLNNRPRKILNFKTPIEALDIFPIKPMRFHI